MRTWQRGDKPWFVPRKPANEREIRQGVVTHVHTKGGVCFVEAPGVSAAVPFEKLYDSRWECVAAVLLAARDDLEEATAAKKAAEKLVEKYRDAAWRATGEIDRCRGLVDWCEAYLRGDATGGCVNLSEEEGRVDNWVARHTPDRPSGADFFDDQAPES